MPRKLPNSSELTLSSSPPYSVTNRKPHASANACTVPTTADSSLNPRPPARGTAAMTTAATMQNAKYPNSALTPTSVAAAAPGNATIDSV